MGDRRAQRFQLPGFPIAQWKALRTKNAPERINEEFRRLTKTQSSPERDASPAT